MILGFFACINKLSKNAGCFLILNHWAANDRLWCIRYLQTRAQCARCFSLRNSGLASGPLAQIPVTGRYGEGAAIKISRNQKRHSPFLIKLVRIKWFLLLFWRMGLFLNSLMKVLLEAKGVFILCVLFKSKFISKATYVFWLQEFNGKMLSNSVIVLYLPSLTYM